MVRRALALSVLVFTAAHAGTDDFLGHWQNADSRSSGLAHVVINPDGGNRVDVRAYGDCHPNVCDWGFVQGKTYTSTAKSDEVEAIVATFHFGFAHRRITFRKGPNGSLAFDMQTDWADGSDKHDFAVSGRLHHTDWAGPVAPLAQKQPGLATGWGGGAHDGAAHKPAESCISYDTHAARAVQQDGRWKVLAGGKPLLDAGSDDKAAVLAEIAIRHYRLDRRCTVGGPWKTYWKSASGFGDDRIGGLACIAFNPTTVHLTRSGGAWQIVDGTTTVVDLGTNKTKADATLGLIRVNRLEALCYVRYPDPIMALWLTQSGQQPN